MQHQRTAAEAAEPRPPKAPAKKERTSVPGVYRRGKTYLYTYRHRGQQKWGTAPTLKEARRQKRQAETDVDRGDHRDAVRLTFGAYAREWLDTYAGRSSRGITGTTLDAYRRSLEGYAIPFFAAECRLRLQEITPPDVRRLVTVMEAAGLAPGSVAKNVAPVRALFATAVEDGVLRHNPTTGVRVNRRRDETDEEPEAKALTKVELSLLMGEVPEAWRLFFQLMAHTGIRISEALGLDRGDVVFGARPVLRVRRQCYRGEIKRLKTGNGRRDLPLSPGMARALWPLCQGPADKPLFATRNVTRYSDRIVRRIFNPAAERAGVPWATFHTLRHTCASILFQNGKNIRQVATWLGHSDPAFTLRTYVHLMDDGLGSADFLDVMAGAGAAAAVPTEVPTEQLEPARTAVTGTR